MFSYIQDAGIKKPLLFLFWFGIYQKKSKMAADGVKNWL